MNMKMRLVAILALLIALLTAVACVSCGKKTGGSASGNGTVAESTSADKNGQPESGNEANKDNDDTNSSNTDNGANGSDDGGESVKEEPTAVDEFIETDENILVEIPIEE